LNQSRCYDAIELIVILLLLLMTPYKTALHQVVHVTQVTS